MLVLGLYPIEALKATNYPVSKQDLSNRLLRARRAMLTDTLRKAVSLLKSAEKSKEESGGGKLQVSILRKRLFSDVSLLLSMSKISGESGGSGVSRTLGQAIEDGVSEGISKYLKGKEENQLRKIPRRKQNQVHA